MIDEKIEPFYDQVVRRNPGHPEFHQAAREVLETLGPVLAKCPEFAEHKILERLCEPERQIIFRVAWQDEAVYLGGGPPVSRPIASIEAAADGVG